MRKIVNVSLIIYFLVSNFLLICVYAFKCNYTKIIENTSALVNICAAYTVKRAYGTGNVINVRGGATV